MYGLLFIGVAVVTVIVIVVKMINNRIEKENARLKAEKQRRNNDLLNAVNRGDKQKVQELLKTDVDVDYMGYISPRNVTLLGVAVENADKEMVSLLIEEGADVNYKYPLDYANNEEIIALLRSHGAKTKEEIEEELKEEQARKEEEKRAEEERKRLEAERKKKEELEKETKYWQDLLIQRNRKIVCKECKTELDKCSEVCPTCGKKIVTVVGKENDCNFSTIQEALDSVEEDAIIKVKPGIYEEHLHFSKKVHLIGCNDSIINKSSNDLPIVVFDSNKSCEIDVPVEIEGIVFTHKKDLQFDTVSAFIKTSLKFEEEKEVYELKSLFIVMSNSSFRNIAILCSERNGLNFYDNNAILEISYLHHLSGFGIFIGKNGNTSIENCIISNSYSSGIYCGDVSSPRIHNSEICNNGEDGASGIDINDQTTAKIYSCKIHNNNLIGVAVEGNSTPKIMSCSIFGQKQGISMEGSSAGIFEDCSIYSNENIGIGILDEANPVINRCKIYSNKQNGIMTGGGVSPQINNSEIINNGECYAGVACLENSRIYMRYCKSHGSNSYGIHLAHNAAGRFENCEFNGVKEDSDYISEFISCRQVY